MRPSQKDLLHSVAPKRQDMHDIMMVAGVGQLSTSPALLASSLSATGGLGPFDLASSVPRHQHQQLASLAMQMQLGSSSGGGGGGVVPARSWVVLTQQEFEARNGCKAPAGKRYFLHTQLADIIAAYPMRGGLQVCVRGC
jgi:hypothetical protein